MTRKIALVRNYHAQGTMKVDPEKIVRVFHNLAGNAADAMPKGGELLVTTQQANGNTTIEFRDTGHGMSDEVKARVFEPFFTAGKRHGTGLGMSIVKKIIDDHHGRIEIDSEPDKGTTVRLILP
jgi:signal transduction histidine kinase